MTAGGIWDWPGLALEPGSAPPLKLTCERGVWGKVHGQRSDFRWLARSGGFIPEDGLPGQLLVGPEDAPARACFWRVLGRRCYAVASYPSRARDAAGRAGFVEKQILGWAPSGVPPALGALVLLPRVAGFGDEVWWRHHAGGDWARDDFAPAIPSEECEDIALFERELEEIIEGARQELARLTTEAALARLYGELLAGRRPALLPGLDRPPSPAALAALLLPLPRPRADRLSLAGWPLSEGASTVELAANWDILACRLPPPGDGPGDPVSEAEEETAAAWARMLLDPGLPGASPSRPGAVREPPLAVPPPAAAPEGGDLGARLASDAPPLLRALVNFADSDHPRDRWLEPDALLERCGLEALDLCEPGGQEDQVLRACVQQVAARARAADPDAARALEAKADLLRALALTLIPGPEMVEAVGWPRSEKVPPLLFAPRLAAAAWPRFRQRLGEENFAEAVRRSRGSRRFQGAIEAWLQKAAPGSLPAPVGRSESPPLAAPLSVGEAKQQLQDCRARYREGQRPQDPDPLLAALAFLLGEGEKPEWWDELLRGGG